ncbi:hypothetical protein GE09DRAFT_1230809 [Coniochaeta sp. 2T2.1]|nr:hypothetical protein GE09DRAFT_1230809 [Coniochaeta sp. 2T2.1]
MSDGVNFTNFPAWEEMDFSQNCTVFGNWLASFLMPNPWDPRERMGGSLPLSISFFLSATPDNFTVPDTAEGQQDLMVEINEWFTFNLYNYYNFTDEFWYLSEEFRERAIWAPLDFCPAEYCKALGYTGNADLTGIGVHVSYYVEATLATLYLIAYTVWQIDKWRKVKYKKSGASAPLLVGGVPGVASDTAAKPKKKRLPLSRRINDSFRGSLGSFLSASMLISIVMLGAGVYVSAFGRDGLRRSSDNPNQSLPYLSSAIYDMVLSLLAGVFSIFPVLLLYALMGRHGGNSSKRKKEAKGGAPDIHRVWLRRCVLAAIWCLGCALVYLAPRGDIDYYERKNHDATWNNDFCDQRGRANYWRGMKAAQWLVIGAPLTYLVITIFLLTGFGIPGIVDRPWVVKWRSVWRLGVAWLNMLAMWGLLAYFTVLRHRIIKTAGGLDNEDKWSFGQILALATWVPVMAEFVYIFIWGIEESLGTHMPVGFRVSRHDQDITSLSVATMGVDPFDDNVPLMGPKATFASDPTTVQMFPINTGYPGGGAAPGNVAAPEANRQSVVYYDSGSTWRSPSTPWDQWNTTGW